MKLIFASDSPRRKELLAGFNLNVEFISHLFDESSINKNTRPVSYCKLMAHEKTNSLVGKYPDYPIISADTIVVSPDNEIFEKPKDKEEKISTRQNQDS